MPIVERLRDTGTRLTVGSFNGDEFDDLLANRLFVRVPPVPWATVVGQGGVPPSLPTTLRASGTPSLGEDVGLAYSDGLPAAPTVLIAGFDTSFAPLKSNVLVPTPDLLVFLPPADDNGALTLDATWTDFPAGVRLWLQMWQPAGPDTRASNGLTFESQ